MHGTPYGYLLHGMELYELTESLAGLPVEVTFLSFDDVLTGGVPQDVQVILVVINNNQPQQTKVFDAQGKLLDISLSAHGINISTLT